MEATSTSAFSPRGQMIPGVVLSATSLIVAANIGDVLLTGAAVIGVTAGIAASIFGARNKASLLAAQTSAEAWERERDAERARADRTQTQLADLMTELATLRGRTDLGSLAATLEASALQTAAEHKLLLEELRTLAKAVSSHTTSLEFLARYVFPQVEGMSVRGDPQDE